MTGITPFVMLPGAGPACEGDDCIPEPGAPALSAAPEQAAVPSAGS